MEALTAHLANPSAAFRRLSDPDFRERLATRGSKHYVAAIPLPTVQPAKKPQRRLSASEMAELVAACRGGGTVKGLAADYGIHHTTVSAHLERQGIRRRRQGLRPEDTEEVARLYEAGWSSAKIGEKFSVDAYTPITALRRAGVVIRPRKGGPR